jgi:hypothetical protein
LEQAGYTLVPVSELLEPKGHPSIKSRAGSGEDRFPHSRE